MEQKYIVAAVLLLASSCVGVLLSTFSQRVRDVFFFLMVTMSAMTERFDVNFFGREWYRGTTYGIEISIVDVLIISVLIGMLLRPGAGQRRWFLPASLGIMTVFFLFSILCVAVSEPKLYGYYHLSKNIRGILIFLAAAFYVRGERELKIFLLALAAIVCYEGFLAIEQRYRFGIHRVFSDFNAANSLSMYCCMTAPVFVAALNSRLPRYVKAASIAAMALAALAVVMTISRAGIVTFALVMLGVTVATVSWKITLRKVVVSALVVAAAAAIVAKSWETLGSRFTEGTLQEEYENRHSQGRGYYIRVALAIVEENWFGVGPNSWSYWVSNKYGPRLGFKFAPYPGTDRMPKFEVDADANVDDPQAAPAHNLAALTLGEMGYGGLVLMVLMWIRWFHMGAMFLWKRTPDPMRRIGVGIFFGTWGIFFQSLTEWVFWQTAIYFTFHILLGVLASLYFHRKKEVREQRRQWRLAREEIETMPSEPAMNL